MRFTQIAMLCGTFALASCNVGNARLGSADELKSFSSEAQLDAYARDMAALAIDWENYDVEYDAGAVLSSIDVAPSEPRGAEQITNTQEAGVDEGGIVKAWGDYLIVLRRGRIFTLRHGGNALEEVDMIDAFPPGDENPGDAWYDEMLVRDGQIITIGYSFGDQGTEISRFDISDEGALSYRDTHYLTSSDYYSSSNYASRLIGDELIFYMPVLVDWSDWRGSLPSLTERQENGVMSEPKALIGPDNLFVPQPYWQEPAGELSTLHTITRCDMSAATLDCEAEAVLGSRSRVFYVARDAAYVWTGGVLRGEGQDFETTSNLLYRLPMDGSPAGAVAVSGGPVNQFSFRRDYESDTLNVVVRQYAHGEGMWGSEFSGGDIGLVTVPLESFTGGKEPLPPAAYRDLPAIKGWNFQNRFMGRHLLYSAAEIGGENDLIAVHIDSDRVTRIDLSHGVSRLDIMGNDGVAIGKGNNGGLGFSSIALNAENGAAALENTHMMAAAREGESRSQAFFYKGDADAKNGQSGIMALPVSRRITRPNRGFLRGGSAMAFLRRENRQLSPIGTLEADSTNAADDGCQTSCVDWYGNARPIFLGGRIFALMGYELVEGELVEGRMASGGIREIRRLDFTPSPESNKLAN